VGESYIWVRSGWALTHMGASPSDMELAGFLHRGEKEGGRSGEEGGIVCEFIFPARGQG
jgi:hypothetical protein